MLNNNNKILGVNRDKFGLGAVLSEQRTFLEKGLPFSHWHRLWSPACPLENGETSHTTWLWDFFLYMFKGLSWEGMISCVMRCLGGTQLTPFSLFSGCPWTSCCPFLYSKKHALHSPVNSGHHPKGANLLFIDLHTLSLLRTCLESQMIQLLVHQTNTNYQTILMDKCARISDESVP